MLFWKKEKETETFALPEPHGLRIGNFVEMDSLDYRLKKDLFVIEGFEFSGPIIAYGGIEIDSEMTIHRLYMENDQFLQLTTENGQVVEGILYKLYDQIDVATENQMAQWLDEEEGLIGLPSFTVFTDENNEDDEGITYHRLIAEDADEKIDPNEQLERKYLKHDCDEYKIINHKMSLYARGVDEEGSIPEFLNVSYEETSDYLSVKIYMGILMPVSDIK